MGRRRTSTPPPQDAIDTLLGSPVAEELDLHGCTRDEARVKLQSVFARMAARRGSAVVRVITGRGNRSEDGPVLRGMVQELLDTSLAPMVRRCQSDLGGGAFLVEIG